MFRQSTTLVMSLLLPISFLLQACGNTGPQPTTVGAVNDSTLGQDFVAASCASQGMQDTDGDGTCDTVEIADPNLGPGCELTADCDNDGIPDGEEDDSFWDNDWNRALVVLASAATAWTIRSCVGPQAGCEWWGKKETSSPIPESTSTNDGKTETVTIGGATGGGGSTTSTPAPTIEIPLNSVGQSSISFNRVNDSDTINPRMALYAYKQGPIKVGNINLENGVHLCIRSKFVIGQSSGSSAPFQLNDGFNLKDTGVSTISEAFASACKNGTSAVTWIGYELNGQSLIEKKNPMIVGFSKAGAASNGNRITRQSQINFSNFTSTNDATAAPEFFFESYATSGVDPIKSKNYKFSSIKGSNQYREKALQACMLQVSNPDPATCMLYALTATVMSLPGRFFQTATTKERADRITFDMLNN